LPSFDYKCTAFYKFYAQTKANFYEKQDRSRPDLLIRFWKKLAWHIMSFLLKVHFSLKRKKYCTIPICTRSILNVDSLDSRRVFSLFERETTTGCL
jgi:hypothetical protein